MGSTDLNNVVRRTTRLLERSFSETIRIETHLDETIPLLRADAAQLEQAILNLCINARDALPEGGSLTVGTQVTQIDAAYTHAYPESNTGTFAMITVADNGQGMSREVAELIFDPFYTTKEPGQGTGLGLSMVYSCLRQHEGWVTVDSMPGHGSTFRLYLPLVMMSDPALEEQGRRELPEGDEVLLLVDDMDLVRNIGREMLTFWGYSVLTAENGEEALAVFSEHRERIALIITDVVMPRCGGEKLVGAIRECGSTVPIILTSGYTYRGQTRGLPTDDLVAFVAKPFQAHILAHAVRDIIDRGKASRRGSIGDTPRI